MKGRTTRIMLGAITTLLAALVATTIIIALQLGATAERREFESCAEGLGFWSASLEDAARIAEVCGR